MVANLEKVVIVNEVEAKAAESEGQVAAALVMETLTPHLRWCQTRLLKQGEAAVTLGAAHVGVDVGSGVRHI